jgi:hypothetical protein
MKIQSMKSWSIVFATIAFLFILAGTIYSQDEGDDFDDVFAELEEPEEDTSAPEPETTEPPSSSSPASKPKEEEPEEESSDDEVTLAALEAGEMEIEEVEETEADDSERKAPPSPFGETKSSYKFTDMLFRLGAGGIAPTDGVYNDIFGWSPAFQLEFHTLYTPVGNAYVGIKFYNQNNDDPLINPVILEDGKPVDYLVYKANVIRTTFQASLGWNMLREIVTFSNSTLDFSLGLFLGFGMTVGFVQDRYNVVIDDYLTQTSRNLTRDSDPFVPLGFEGSIGIQAEIWKGLGAFVEFTYGLNGGGKSNTNFDGFYIRGGVSYCLHSAIRYKSKKNE